MPAFREEVGPAWWWWWRRRRRRRRWWWCASWALQGAGPGSVQHRQADRPVSSLLYASTGGGRGVCAQVGGAWRGGLVAGRRAAVAGYHANHAGNIQEHSADMGGYSDGLDQRYYSLFFKALPRAPCRVKSKLPVFLGSQTQLQPVSNTISSKCANSASACGSSVVSNAGKQIQKLWSEVATAGRIIMHSSRPNYHGSVDMPNPGKDPWHI